MFKAVLHVGIVVQLTLGILGMAVIILTAQFAVPFLFGSRYTTTVPILTILAVTIPIRFVQHSYASAFYSKEHMVRKVTYMGIAAAISVALNLILTWQVGLAGAAISAIAAELSLLLLFFQGAARYIDGVDVWATFRPRVLRESLMYINNARKNAV
jgi:O-antigen/teichoic acid export membrane protein